MHNLTKPIQTENLVQVHLRLTPSSQETEWADSTAQVQVHTGYSIVSYKSIYEESLQTTTTYRHTCELWLA